MGIRFQREALFEEVWSNPLTSLAKKYGMSDNGIRKVCKTLSIPLPSAGHWAKIAAGRVIPRPILRPTTGPSEFYSSPPARTPSTPAQSEDEEWLAGRLAFEENAENRMSVEMQPQRWHKLIVKTRSRLQEQVREMEQSRRAAEKPPKPTRFPQLASSDLAWKWDYFVRGGQILDLNRTHLPLRVTPRTYERALCIVNAVLFAAEVRGIKLLHDEKSGRLSLEIHECSIHVRFSERIGEELRDTQTEAALERRRGKEMVKVPTGILRIHFSPHRYSEAQIEESRDVALETKLNDFFKRVYRAVVRERAAERSRVEWRLAFEAEQARLREAEERKQEEQRQAEKERERRKGLLSEAVSWHNASLLRAYLNHIEARIKEQSTGPGRELRGWLFWASIVAEELDPTAMRIHNVDKRT